MNPWRWVDPRVRDLPLSHVRRYLQARGWQEKKTAPPGVPVYEAPPGGNGAVRPTCVLPGSETAPDYVLSLTYLLTALSELEDRHPVAVLEEMLSVSSSPRP